MKVEPRPNPNSNWLEPSRKKPRFSENSGNRVILPGVYPGLGKSVRWSDSGELGVILQVVDLRRGCCGPRTSVPAHPAGRVRVTSGPALSQSFDTRQLAARSS
jgi:hypothetical protein